MKLHVIWNDGEREEFDISERDNIQNLSGRLQIINDSPIILSKNKEGYFYRGINLGHAREFWVE